MNFKNFRNLKNSSAFTLMELLIVIALIALIAAGLLVLINPMQQFAKANDAKRKLELDALRKAFEEYYNDKGCYPLPEEVCFDQPQNICDVLKTTTSQVCHICGRETIPTEYAKFAPYLSQLPCDPEHSKKDYLYEIDISCSRANSCNDSINNCTTCPKWYRIYSHLSVKRDSDSINVGCYDGGCGLNLPAPATDFGYDYGVSSSNVSLNYANDATCIYPVRGFCNGCGDSNRDGILNTYLDCTFNDSCDQNKVYGTMENCCEANPSGCR